MPYIEQDDRKYLDDKIANIVLQSPGELNYIITKLLDRYIAVNKKNYKVLNETIGVLECAKLELYRRIAAPYEDEKIKQNGDVYTV